jgi:hypothetical protein
LKAATNLESLDLGKNYIKSGIGVTLKNYIELNKNLKRLNLEYNELLVGGVREFRNGLVYT